GWRACLAARRGQGAHAGRREGGGRGDERAAGQGAHICSWRGGVPGRAPGRTAGAGPDVLEGPRARGGASTSRRRPRHRPTRRDSVERRETREPEGREDSSAARGRGCAARGGRDTESE